MKVIADISIRVNPDVETKTHPYISTGMKENKFGIPYDDAFALFKKAHKLSSLNILGIDFHIGSQIMSTAPYLESISSVKKLINKLKKANINISHIDVGGGLGVAYKNEEAVSKPDFIKSITNALSDYDVDIIFEPGRSIVGDCGILVSEVQYIKETSAKNFMIVDASMSELMRPPLYLSLIHI